MRALMLVPHADDETLFASHLIAKYDPTVMVVYLPENPDERAIRESEMNSAVAIIRDQDEQMMEEVEWLGAYEGTKAVGLKERLERYRPPGFLGRSRDTRYFDYVFAPLVEDDGHAEHNHVGQAATTVWEPDQVSYYATYSRSGGRTHVGTEIDLPTWLVQRKLRALAEYGSQIDYPDRRPWFAPLPDLREWVIHP